MAPSEEAMAVAEKLVRMEVAHETPDCTLVVAGVELYSVNASQGYMSEMYDTVCELQAGIATALDAHTADLRREVEALRAERDKYKEQVRGFQGAVLELLMVADPDFSTKTFTVPFEEWDYLMSADQNAKDPNQKEIII